MDATQDVRPSSRGWRSRSPIPAARSSWKETSATLKTVRAAETASAVSWSPGWRRGRRGRRAPQEPARRLQAHSGALAGLEILDELGEVNRSYREGDARGRRGVPQVAARRCAGGGERRQGRRLPRLPRRARERGRAAHARQPPRRAAGGMSAGIVRVPLLDAALEARPRSGRSGAPASSWRPGRRRAATGIRATWSATSPPGRSA